MKLKHTQPDPLPLTPLRWERLPYMWTMIQDTPLAFDDYTPLSWYEFIIVTMGPASMSWEIGEGVGLTTLVFCDANAYIQMVMFDWKFRDYVCDFVIQEAFKRGANRVTSTVTEDRMTARELVERMGLKYEGRTRKAFLRAGKYLDVDMYGALKKEYVWP